MTRAGTRHEEQLLRQFQEYRAELKRQFCRNCVAFAFALALLLVLSQAAIWAVMVICFWTLMLVSEAHTVYSKSETVKSSGFLRWQSRQAWVAAADGDIRSLKRLQNVQ